MADDPLGEPIVIRFDGLDADQHTLELDSLAEALGGLSRIISVSSHFALTQELALQRRTFKVRVVAQAPRDGCFIINAVVQYSHHHPLIKEYAVETIAGLTVTAIAYIFAWAANKKAEMKFLSGALEKAIGELGSRDQPTIDGLLSTIETMAEKLRPAVKRAVAPVGVSARTLSVGIASSAVPVVIDEADKAAINSPAGLTVDEEQSYVVLISELDMQTGACHVALAGDAPDDRRFPAKITDPAFSIPNNPYVLAMAAKTPLGVRAKATIRDGEIERLFISNYAGRQRGDPNFELA